MARRPQNEVVDRLCRDWGRTRRQILGLDDPQLAKEYVGALKSTLGQRRDLHAGSRSNKLEQHWPETYTGESFYVNQAHHAMRPEMRMVMDLHYCAQVEAERKAEFLCISRKVYFEQVNAVRAFVEGWLARADAA